MQRRFLITAAAICIAILIILLKRPTNLPSDPIARYRLLHYSRTMSMNDYEAPLHLGDNPTRVPHEYIVFLHLGYSLEQHKQAVGDSADLDSAIMYIFPETASNGIYYSAELHNASLAAVRADTGVDMVESNIQVYLID